MVEHAAVNRVVVGSSPTSGASLHFSFGILKVLALTSSFQVVGAGIFGIRGVRHCYFVYSSHSMALERTVSELPFKVAKHLEFNFPNNHSLLLVFQP